MFVEHQFQERQSKDLWLIQSSLIIKNAEGLEYALEKKQILENYAFLQPPSSFTTFTFLSSLSANSFL